MRDVTTLSRRERHLARIEAAAEELGMRIAEYDEYLRTPEGMHAERLFQEQTQGRIVPEQNEEHDRSSPAAASDESVDNPNSDDSEYP
ncbi:hypothetical protein CDV36_008862 [Fusarium kuroshium]|uniref:Uncharacterized protein n=1 Tax=Fusarium kuroshium TaxID=2010991 RepID=A0A3M2S1T6_9HYPO|nr:hypothetical protein CDV36_008862 [Fusarium kuroshium]